ncbi:hypothetical protein GCM10023201_41350 [Actinomycetospora corticicola]|uniref:Uncharacterized protein n=1 Tax=Actinomycetospora corticicola TaxID=663602 RepID=A0A7Y9DWF6_9PSEU|nr:hypothetical protein [Actinomycetospora corticicola]NYD36778.1 hypothetical protein [Actinomycetospora corticicola]
MSAPHYVVRGDLSSEGPDLYAESGKLVAWADSPERAHFLAEAHNAYVPALRMLIRVLHVDAIPESWSAEGRGPISIREVAERIAELLPADSVGAPLSADEVRDAAIADRARAASDTLNGASA